MSSRRERIREAGRAFWVRRFDLVAVAGAGVAAWGIGLIYPPAGVIAAGAALGACGIVGAMVAARAKRPG